MKSPFCVLRWYLYNTETSWWEFYNIWWWQQQWDGIVSYLTSYEAYCLWVGNHSRHNLHTRGWGDTKMKGQPNQDSNPVPPSQGSNHTTDWANEASSVIKERVPQRLLAWPGLSKKVLSEVCWELSPPSQMDGRQWTQLYFYLCSNKDSNWNHQNYKMK